MSFQPCPLERRFKTSKAPSAMHVPNVDPHSPLLLLLPIMAAAAAAANAPVLLALCIFAFFSLPTSSRTISGRISSSGISRGIRLIRRDSPLSPTYDSNATVYDRVRASLRRSQQRMEYFRWRSGRRAAPSATRAPVHPVKGEYLMQYGIGTPPQWLYSTMDTGSGLTWVQCFPCRDCFPMDHGPFTPSTSLTYGVVKCGDAACTMAPNGRCENNGCSYSQDYGDGESTSGELSTETLTFGSTGKTNDTFKNVVFGCSHQTSRGFEPQDSGIVGLSRRPVSLVSQLKFRRFSYCLVPPNDDTSGSQLLLGPDALISGGKTHMVNVPWASDLYHLRLEGISVAGSLLPIPEDLFIPKADGSGGLVIDSGTTATYLATAGHDALVQAVVDNVQGFTTVTGHDFHLCYAASFSDLEQATPLISFHFNGFDFLFTARSAYIPVEEGTWCLGVLPTTDVSLLGNWAQQNYIVGYDLDEEAVSFAAADCATF